MKIEKRITMALNEEIRKLRTDHGYTQNEMADLLKVSRSTLAKWENGNSIPTAEDLKMIKEVFGVSVDALLEEKGGIVEAYDISKGDNGNSVKILLLGLSFALTFASILFDISDILDAKGNYINVPILSILFLASDLLITICIVAWIVCLFRKKIDIKNACSTVVTYYLCEIFRSLVGYFFINNIELSTTTMTVYELLRYLVLPLVCVISVVAFYKKDDYVNPNIVILIFVTRILGSVMRVGKSIFQNRKRLLYFDYSFVHTNIRFWSLVTICVMFLYYALVLTKKRKEKKTMLKNNRGGGSLKA